VEDERLMDLQVRLAFQEKAIADLDDVVRALRDELDRVTAEVRELRGQVASQVVEDAPPPHW
jgi:uncharacterized coiled-coil protein SlyX